MLMLIRSTKSNKSLIFLFLFIIIIIFKTLLISKFLITFKTLKLFRFRIIILFYFDCLLDINIFFIRILFKSSLDILFFYWWQFSWFSSDVISHKISIKINFIVINFSLFLLRWFGFRFLWIIFHFLFF